MSGTSLALIFSLVSNTFSLPPGLLSAVCFVESSHRPKVVNLEDGGADSLGLCQVKLDTAKFMGFKGTTKQLMQPKTNAFYAGKYLRFQLNRYADDADKAIAAYNAGTYRTNPKGQIMNRTYVKKVKMAWSEKR